MNSTAQLNEFGQQSSLPSLGKRFTGNPLTFFEPVTENTVRKFVQNSAPETRELDPIPTSLLVEYYTTDPNPAC